jgi:hypothetical protein
MSIGPEHVCAALCERTTVAKQLWVRHLPSQPLARRLFSECHSGTLSEPGPRFACSGNPTGKAGARGSPGSDVICQQPNQAIKQPAAASSGDPEKSAAAGHIRQSA